MSKHIRVAETVSKRPCRDNKMITGSFTRRLWDHVGTRASRREQTGISGERNYETFKSHNELPLFNAGRARRAGKCWTHQQGKVCVRFVFRLPRRLASVTLLTLVCLTSV